jgi:hypothetical protein
VVGAGHVALATAGDDGAIVRITDTRSPQPTATFALDGAGAVSLRFAGDLLVMGDDRGRLVVIDLASGAVRAELRLRA